LKKRLFQAKEILRKEYGFDPATRPVRRDGCLEPRIHEQLINSAFLPAKENVLLAGDAAGFQLPNSMGIGTALLSGFMAGESILESIKKGIPADDLYLQRTKQIIEVIKTQWVGALNSRYSQMSDGEEAASKITSFFIETAF
jgi:flavin-dependent dehydrogenase